MKLSWLRAAAAVCFLTGACTGKGLDPPAPSTSTSMKVIAHPHATTFSERVQTTLPDFADGEVRLSVDHSDAFVAFALEGALPSPAERAGVEARYGAYRNADALYRINERGVEDFIDFRARPEAEEVVYRLRLSGFAGLRLVEGVVEMLDEGGAPRMRIAKPYVVDAAGTRTEAVPSIEGCHYDDDPRAPWGRPPVDPGSDECRLRFAFHAEKYPALFDPTWTTTGSLVQARAAHRAVLLASKKVLLAGGSDTTSTSTTTLASAEIFDETTGTFAVTGSMNTARSSPCLVTLLTGKLLAIGGGTTVTTADIYDPATGQWTPTGSMAAPLVSGMGCVTLNDGTVLAAGGATATDAQDTAQIYNPTTGTFGNEMSLPNSHAFPAVVKLANGDVLVASGRVGVLSNNDDTNSVEIFHAATKTFAPTGFLTTARDGHVGALLPNGKAIIVGGETNGSCCSKTAEVYDPTTGAFSPLVTMAAAHDSAATSLLPNGQLLVSGSNFDIAGVVDVYDPTTNTFVAAKPLTTHRYGHTATLLASGRILAAGGQGGAIGASLTTASAELYSALTDSLGCKDASECNSGFCVDGVCCDTACDGQCSACDVAGAAGKCTAVLGDPHGMRTQCPGAGTCGGTCDGKTLGACVYPTVACGSSCESAQFSTSKCDGKGKCVATDPVACDNNLICASATACKTTCATSADCAPTFACSPDHKCIAGGSCVDEATSQPGDGGAPIACAPYKCTTAGACGTTCASVDDCTSPNICDSTGHCAAPPTSSSGGCSASHEESSEGTFWMLGLVLFVLGGRAGRRNGSHRTLARHVRALLAFFVVLTFAFVESTAHAQAPAATAAPATEEARKADARTHFDLGLTHFDREEWQAALVEFLKSREIYPSKGNTKNAAICLRKVGRYDESLDLFEKLLKDFPDLSPADRALGEKESGELRASIGSITIANAPAGASVVIDGVDRGKAPLAGPLRLSAGSHLVRVTSEGTLPFEQRFDLAGKQALVIAVSLTTLTQAGRVHVTEHTGKTLDVVLDGVVVGRTPFDGAVAPGVHTILLKGDASLGTQPASVTVTLEKVTNLDPTAEELHGQLRIEASPGSAAISVDGVPLGSGHFEGRMRTGNHKISVTADGYTPFINEVVLEPDQAQVVSAKLAPAVRAVASRVIIELDAGLALGALTGGDIANACTGSCSQSLPIGFHALLHGTYQFGSGLGLGIHAGYLLASYSQTGRAETISPTGKATNQGTVSDSLRLGGLTAGLEAQYKVGTDWPATLRLGVGALLGSVQDTRNGTFTDSTGAGYTLPDTTQSPGATYLYLSPEARIGKKLGENLEVTVGAEVLVMTALSTPRWDNTKLLSAGKDGAGPMPAESLLGSLVLIVVPGAGVSYTF